MIRCVRIWTGDDRNSHFEEGVIDLEPGARGDMLSGKMATTISFEETASGGAFAWHDAPIRQLVITLSGTLDFQTREGKHFLIRPGDVLLAEDTIGSGHSWRLTDSQPWRRAYVILQPGAAVPFRAIHRHDLVVETGKPALIALDQLRIERPLPIAGDADVDLRCFRQDRLLRRAVATALSHLAFLLLITYLTAGLGFNRFNGLGSR
jgi:hypothetical protein